MKEGEPIELELELLSCLSKGVEEGWQLGCYNYGILGGGGIMLTGFKMLEMASVAAWPVLDRDTEIVCLSQE